MNTASSFAAAPAAPTAGVFRRCFAWALVLVMVPSMSINGLDYGKADNFGTAATIIGGVLLMIAAYKNWRMLWNWFGRFLRSSLGEKSARVALGLIGGAFAAGGL